MIEYDEYWKKELEKIRIRLEKRYNQKRINKLTEYNIEKDCFFGFFSIRKLIDSGKVAQEFQNFKLTLYSYPEIEQPNESPTHFLHNYNLFTGKKENISIQYISNQFIHSSYFSPFVFGSKNLGFYLASDKALVNKKVYYIPLFKVLSIFKSVITGEIISACVSTANEERKVYYGKYTNIRKATIKDLPFLRKMLYEAAYWRQDVEKPDLETGLAREDISYLLKNWGLHGDIAIIAEVDDKPVGAAWFRLWTQDKHSFGYIADNIPEIGIGVSANHRKKGIGKALMIELIKSAESQLFPAISLSVEKENYACQFYMKLGFKIHEENKHDFTLIYELPKFKNNYPL